jgi:hypothetical protein
MFRKCLILIGAVLVASTVARAESMRTVLCKENKLPGLSKVEVGALGRYDAVPNHWDAGESNHDEYWATPYVRYGVLENLALFAEVPFARIDQELGGTDTGIGDVAAGFELRGYEDVLGYPWVLPHLTMSFNTGDEEKGFGTGSTVITPGVSVGTTVENIFHWVLDGRYSFNDSEGDNIASVQGAFIWDLNQQFSLLVEGRATDENTPEREHPFLVLGGMSYQANENLMIGAYGGAGHDVSDATAVLKVAYTF